MSKVDWIRKLETAASAAMPALINRYYDGWVLRFAKGYTRRANSVYPLYASSLNLDEKIIHCETLYTSFSLPTIFKLTEACVPADLDAILTERGYELGAESHLKTLDLATFPSQPTISGSAALTPLWLKAYAQLNQVSPSYQDILQAMLKSINRTVWFALIKDETNVPLAVGLGVVEDDLLGIFDIVVAESQRQKGYGVQLMNGLLSWGKENGARTAYLQVNAANAAGQALYTKLGFVESYRYWYRVKA